MNKSTLILTCATALLATSAFAQTSSTDSTTTTTSAGGQTSSQTTTTTTEGAGTITEYTPGSVIMLKESSGPRSYKFGKTVTYVTAGGQAITEDQVKTRIKVGIPVHVQYATEGDSYIVSRVVVDE